jgi:hypothetical protein
LLLEVDERDPKGGLLRLDVTEAPHNGAHQFLQLVEVLDDVVQGVPPLSWFMISIKSRGSCEIERTTVIQETQ